MDEGLNCRDARLPGDQKTFALDSRYLPDEERRRLLTLIGGVGVTMLAGCLDEEDSDVTSHTIVFFDQDGRTEVEISENEKLLYPALDAGVDIPYSCEVGRCGECTVKYDGNANDVVTHDGNEFLDETQIEDGWILTCVAFPKDRFELEVAHPDNE